MPSLSAFRRVAYPLIATALVISCFAYLPQTYAAPAQDPVATESFFRNALHSTRGGNIYIESPLERNRDKSNLGAAIYFNDDSQRIFARSGSLRDGIDAAEVADFIALSVGAPLTNEPSEKAKASVRASLVEAATTNVFLGIHGFDVLTAGRHNLENLKKMTEAAAVSGHLTYNAAARNPTALVHTIGTGAYPSKHGIVGPQWVEIDETVEPAMYSVVDAYSSENAQSLVPTIGERIANGFNQRAHVVSVSGTNHLGSPAFGLRELPQKLDAIPTTLEEHLSLGDLYASLSSHKLSVQLDATAKQVIVQRLRQPVHLRPGQFEDLEPVRFDLKDARVAAFFGELIYFKQVAAAFSQAENRAAPNFYAFIYTTFPELVQAVRAHSGKVAAAAATIDAHVGQLLSLLKETSAKGLLVTELALLGSLSEYRRAPVVDRRAVLSAVSEVYPDALYRAEDFYPSFRVPASQASSICADLSVRLAAYRDVRVLCALPSNDAAAAVSFLEQSVNLKAQSAFSTLAQPSSDDVNRYQIVLWTFAILFFATMYALSNTAFMEFKKDQSLFGTVHAGRR